MNVTGSFVLGLPRRACSLTRGSTPDVRTVVGTGFIGAYTTFSSFSYETFGLFEDRATVAALVNALGSVAVGLVAATAGFGLAGRLLSLDAERGVGRERGAELIGDRHRDDRTLDRHADVEIGDRARAGRTSRPRPSTGIAAPSSGSV